MSLPITIGLELENLVGYIEEGTKYTSQPGSENRKHEFLGRPGRVIVRGPHDPFEIGRLIKDDIARTIRADGRFAIDVANYRKVNPNVWQIVDDNTIKAPLYNANDPFGYESIEIKSPALVFCQESVDEIEAMCELLNSRYYINANISCGLHVHIGHHRRGFKFTDIQKLVAFLYTFEPQIDSLHPPHRLDQKYGNTMRRRSRFAVNNREEETDQNLTSRDFARFVFAQEDRSVFLKEVSDFIGPGYGNYNFGGIADEPSGHPMDRQTIEFRQHEGTFDHKAITNWIEVVVGIIQFVEGSDPIVFHDLLTTAWKAETWMKLGDDKDKQREYELGPHLADEGFTITDLLMHIGCRKQAKYYNNRWQKHEYDYPAFG